MWKSNVHVWAWQVGAKGAGDSIWDPDESVQLLRVISVMGKTKKKPKWVDAIWCLLEDSSLIQARHELMISRLIPLTLVVMA